MRMQRGFSTPQQSGETAGGKAGRATDKSNRRRAAVAVKPRSAARTAPLAPPHPAGRSSLPVISITGKEVMR
jgi:hypothetical protein